MAIDLGITRVTVELDLSPRLRRALRKMKVQIMAQIEDLTGLVTDVQDGLGAVQTDVDRILAQLVNMPGTLTPEQQTIVDDTAAGLGAIRDTLSSLDTQIDAVSPDEPAATEPALSAGDEQAGTPTNPSGL